MNNLIDFFRNSFFLRHPLTLFASLLLLFGCREKEAKKNIPANFESLMGKEFSSWQFIQTPEDFENLKFFKELYEKNSDLFSIKSQITRIPKVVHFIWIGPRPFPRESVENVRSWIARHPDWTFKFWTDRERPLPHPKMQKVMIQDLKFLKLYECYKKSDNFGEKSDLLRCEILYQEGGIYVDHDIKCFKSFDALSRNYDLFCGMEMPYKTSLSTCVLPTNNIVASRPGHPILKRAMDWVCEHWERIENEYPGKDRDCVINRVAHRTFLAFGESFRLLANQEGNRDIAFPAYYFNAPNDSLAIYARHLYAGTWFENETAFEKLVRERLMKISKKTNKILLFFGGMTLVNIMGFALLFLKYRRVVRKA